MTYSGPHIETQFANGTNAGFRQTRKRYRQKAPYVDNLPYDFERADSRTLPNPFGVTYGSSYTTSAGCTSANPQALSKAYAEFVDAAKGVTASMAVNLAERKQAIDMMSSRCMQMYKFARHLRKFEFPSAVRTLGYDVVSARDTKRYWRARIRRKEEDREVRFKKTVSGFGDNFLEVHFGWEPTIKDIYSAVELSTSAYFPGLMRHCEGKGSVRRKMDLTPVVTALWSYGSKTEYPRSSVRIGGDVVVTNPNALLMNLYGLVNPAVVIWELVPFSFLVDWFVNIGQVLSSYSDFVGLNVTNVYTSFRNEKVVTEYYTGYPNGYTPPTATVAVREKKIVVTSRKLGLTMPSVAVKQLKLPSVTRGLTAASLLAQFLGK